MQPAWAEKNKLFDEIPSNEPSVMLGASLPVLHPERVKIINWSVLVAHILKIGKSQ